VLLGPTALVPQLAPAPSSKSITTQHSPRIDEKGSPGDSVTAGENHDYSCASNLNGVDVRSRSRAHRGQVRCPRRTQSETRPSQPTGVTESVEPLLLGPRPRQYRNQTPSPAAHIALANEHKFRHTSP
jgi:hypothetical protein